MPTAFIYINLFYFFFSQGLSPKVREIIAKRANKHHFELFLLPFAFWKEDLFFCYLFDSKRLFSKSIIADKLEL